MYIFLWIYISSYVYMLHDIFIFIQPDSVQANTQPWWPKWSNHRGYWAPTQFPFASTRAHSPFSSHNVDKMWPTFGPCSRSSRLPVQPVGPAPWMESLLCSHQGNAGDRLQLLLCWILEKSFFFFASVLKTSSGKQTSLVLSVPMVLL